MPKDSAYYREYYARVIKPRRQAALVEVLRGKCYYCGLERRLTRDHVIARTKGSTGAHSNIVGACFWCNNSKGNLSIEEWRLSIAKRLVGWPNFVPGQIAWLKSHGFDPVAVALRELPAVKFAFEGGNTLEQWSSKARHRREFPPEQL